MTTGNTRKPPLGQGRLSVETGFTMIELLIVIAIILIMASFAAPIYSRIVTRSHEAVLKDDLFTLREMINRYTLDNHKPPESLQALVKAGYFSGGLPVDPFTGSNKTWQPVIQQVQISPDETLTGVVNVHSGSNAKSLEGPWLAIGSPVLAARLVSASSVSRKLPHGAHGASLWPLCSSFTRHRAHRENKKQRLYRGGHAGASLHPIRPNRIPCEIILDSHGLEW